MCIRDSLSTIVWLAAGLLIGAVAKSLLGLPVNIEGMAAFISLVMGYCGSVKMCIRDR